MPRPHQRIQIFSIQDRRSTKHATRPWIVRWAIDGRERSRAFCRKGEAERYRQDLFNAVADGARFDPVTGEPVTWETPLGDLGVHEWARRWLAEEWVEWAPRTRDSAAEAVARFVVLAVAGRAAPPDGLRTYLRKTLGPGTEDARRPEIEAWLHRHCYRLVDLDRERTRAVVHALMLKDDGTPLAPSNVARLRAICHACLLAAIDIGAIDVDPWPRRTRAHARRKSVRKRRGVDIRKLPSPETMETILAAMPNDKPGSLVYQAMTAVIYYAGLRPSEVVMLRVRSLTLPAEGWGRIDVTEADVGDDVPGEPKTGPRSVPIPPVLVERLTRWVDDHRLTTRDALLFRTRNDTRPGQQNWARALKRALALVDHEPLRVYDCRHAAATTWLRAGVPLGEVARRMGHSVDTLVANWVGALDTDEEIGNAKIEALLNSSSGRPAPEPTPPAEAPPAPAAEAGERPHLYVVRSSA